ncbi:MAG: alpha/beta hydrolase [Succinivibrionaceae bacterium]|nr:alpha/beta hydrolase [Succinivibrionaceae bacterium]
MIEFTSENELNNSYRRNLIEFKNNCCVCQRLEIEKYSILTISCTHHDARARGKLFFIQGRAETIDKYLSLFQDLYNAGYDIYSYDHPGQGYSGRKKDKGLSWIGSFSVYVNVLTEVVKHFSAENASFIAVSMGGLVATMAMNRQLLSPGKIVLVTPMFRVDRKHLPSWLAHMICQAFDIAGFVTGNRRSSPPGQKRYSRPAFASNNKTHSERRLNFYHDWYESDEIFPIGGVTWKWLMEAYLNEPRRIEAGSASVLLIEAQHDSVVDNSSNEEIIRNSEGSIQLRRIKGGFHDLLNETDSIRNLTLQQILNFIES